MRGGIHVMQLSSKNLSVTTLVILHTSPTNVDKEWHTIFFAYTRGVGLHDIFTDVDREMT